MSVVIGIPQGEMIKKTTTHQCSAMVSAGELLKDDERKAIEEVGCFVVFNVGIDFCIARPQDPIPQYAKVQRDSNGMPKLVLARM